jgi:hypothetical protein
VFESGYLLTPNMGGRFLSPKKQGMLPHRPHFRAVQWLEETSNASETLCFC